MGETRVIIEEPRWDSDSREIEGTWIVQGTEVGLLCDADDLEEGLRRAESALATLGHRLAAVRATAAEALQVDSTTLELDAVTLRRDGICEVVLDDGALQVVVVRVRTDGTIEDVTTR